MDSADLSRLLLPIRPSDHVHGSEDAPFTLVEYGDYECPDCGRLFAVLHDLQNDSAAQLRIVFRHYPRSGVHHHAQQAQIENRRRPEHDGHGEGMNRLNDRELPVGVLDAAGPRQALKPLTNAEDGHRLYFFSFEKNLL